MKDKLITATFFQIRNFSRLISTEDMELTGRIPSLAFWKFGFCWIWLFAGANLVSNWNNCKRRISFISSYYHHEGFLLTSASRPWTIYYKTT